MSNPEQDLEEKKRTLVHEWFNPDKVGKDLAKIHGVFETVNRQVYGEERATANYARWREVFGCLGCLSTVALFAFCAMAAKFGNDSLKNYVQPTAPSQPTYSVPIFTVVPEYLPTPAETKILTPRDLCITF